MSARSLPAAEVTQRLRESASLSATELDARIAKIARTNIGDASRAAAGALVDDWLRRTGKRGSGAMRSAATALGAGYVTGRALLGDPPRLNAPPQQGARELLGRMREWDQGALYDAAGLSAESVRKRLNDRTADGLFSAGLALAVAEADVAVGDERV